MAKYATVDIVDKHFDEFQVLSGEVRRYLASIASCGSTIRKMCQLEKKKAQDQLKVIDAEQVKTAQGQLQLTETALQLQTLFRRSAKMRDRQADCLLACVVDPWDEFVRSRMRKLKDLVASHRQTSKSISALCVTVASHRNECLRMFGQLNVQIAQKAAKEEEGKQKNKKQGFFAKLGKNLTQYQQKVLKAFTRFEEELRSLNELSATSRELRKKICRILHDVQKVERHCILLVDTQLLHQNRLNIEVSQNFRTVMKQHIPSHKKMVDTRVSSLAVFDYETPIHSSEIMEHLDESQTHEHPHYDIGISGLSGKDRHQVKREDKDCRDDASEDSATFDDLRPSKEFLHRADVADALQSLNASALLTATVMSDYVDPDDDEKLKALFVRHMSRKEKKQSNASSISGIGTPSSDSAAGTPRSGSGASAVSGGGKLSAAKNLFSFTRSRSPSTQLANGPKSDHPPEKDKDANGRQILDGEDPFPDLAKSDSGNRLKGPPVAKKAATPLRSASKVSKLTANFERIDAVARSDVKPVMEDKEAEPVERLEKNEKEEADVDDNGRPILDGASVWDRISSYFSQTDYDDDPMDDPDAIYEEDERDDGPPLPIPTMASDDSAATPQQSDVRPASMGENSSSRPYPSERSHSKSVGIGGFTVEESISDDEKEVDGGFSISSVFGSISRSSKKKKEREVVDLVGILSATGVKANDGGNRSRSSSGQHIGYGPCQCGCKTFVRRPFQNGCQECFHIHPKLDAADGTSRSSNPPSTASPKSKTRNQPLSPNAKSMNAKTLTSMGSNMLSRIKGAANTAQERMSRSKTPHPPDSPQSSAPSSPNLNDGFKTPKPKPPRHSRASSTKTSSTQSPFSSLSKGSGRNAMSPPRSPSSRGKNSPFSNSRPSLPNGTDTLESMKTGPDFVQAPGSNRGVRPNSKSNSQSSIPPGSGNYFARTGSPMPSPPNSPQMGSGNYSTGLSSGKKPPLPAGMKPNPTLTPSPGLGSGTYSLPKPALPNSPKPAPALPNSPKPKPHLAVPGGGSQRRKKMRSAGSIGRFTSRFRKEILVIDDTTLLPDDVPTSTPEETAAALAASRRGPRAM